MDGQSPKTLVAVGASDSAGADGIAADIRTFAAMGVHGAAVVTGILAKRGDDTEVVVAIPAGEIVRQIESALVVTGAEVVKIGWMADAESVAGVSQALDRASIKHVVADPDLAHAEDALKGALKTELMPVAEVVTISMPEATALLGIPIRNALGLRAVGKLLDRAGAANVIAKGGHLGGDECLDILWDGSEYLEYPSERIDTSSDDGAGSTLASAIASGLALGRGVEEAVAIAKMYVTETLRNSYAVGPSGGSPSQLYRWWETGGSDGYGG